MARTKLISEKRSFKKNDRVFIEHIPLRDILIDLSTLGGEGTLVVAPETATVVSNTLPPDVTLQKVNFRPRTTNPDVDHQ